MRFEFFKCFPFLSTLPNFTRGFGIGLKNVFLSNHGKWNINVHNKIIIISRGNIIVLVWRLNRTKESKVLDDTIVFIKALALKYPFWSSLDLHPLQPFM